MANEVKLSRLGATLDQLSYPISREDAADQLGDVTLSLADGERNLGDQVSELPESEFDSTDELTNAIENNLPREAVGEPYQSEGEG